MQESVYLTKERDLPIRRLIIVYCIICCSALLECGLVFLEVRAVVSVVDSSQYGLPQIFHGSLSLGSNNDQHQCVCDDAPYEDRLYFGVVLHHHRLSVLDNRRFQIISSGYTFIIVKWASKQCS